MKSNLTLLVFGLLSLVARAQKADLDRYWYNISSRSLPSNPLPEGSRTYKVEITNSSIVSMIYSNDAIKGAVFIDGFKMVEPKGHLNISVFFSDLHFEKSGVTERKEDIKDKDGKVTGQKSYFAAWGNYRFGAESTIKDSNFTQIDRIQHMSTNNVLTYTTQEFGTYNEAGQYYNNNMAEIKRNLAKTHVDNAMAALRQHLKVRYGYPVNDTRDYMWILDSKKHPEYKQQQEVWDQFKAIAKKFNGTVVTPDALKEELKPALAYFESLPSRFTSDEKADKKIRHGGFYAKAKIYLLLDEPEKALEEAEKLVANGFDVKDADVIKGEANTLIDRFKRNGVRSTHFPLDVTLNMPPR
jgi:hypothetical protein